MKNKKLLWTVVGCFVLLVAVFSWKLVEAGRNSVVAVVGGQSISTEDWEQQLKKEYGESVLHKMIDRILVYREAERLGITVSDEEIKYEMANIKESYGSEMEGGFTEENMGLTPEQLREELRYSLLLEELAMKDVYITDAEIKDYYEKNLDQFVEPASAYLFQIVVETEAEARQVIQELNDGSNFSTLAMERSIDILNTGNGGEIGWVTIDHPYADPSVLQVALEIPIKQISKPIKTENGYAVIKVTERKAERQKPLEQVKREIRRQLAFNEAEPLPQLLQRLRDQAGVQIFLD